MRRLMNADDIASRSGTSTSQQRANAHAVFDRFCGWNNDIFRMADAEIAYRKGEFDYSKVAKDHAEFDKP